MNLFGKKKAQPKLTDSIMQLRETMTTLEKRELFLQKQADECLEKAKVKSKKGDKRGALFELKRKKMFEKQIEGMFGKRVNLETQIMALQSAAANKDVLSAMKAGRDAISSHISEAQLDEVADVMDQIDENVNLVDEMDQALSQPIGGVMDEDDLEAELNDLEEAMLQEEILADEPLAIPSVRSKVQERPLVMPEAPSRPVAAATEEDDELAALEAELL